MKKEKIPESILAKRITNGQMFFYVKWEGLNKKYNSWEKKENLENWKILENNFTKEQEEKEYLLNEQKDSQLTKKSDRKKILQFGKVNDQQISIDDMYGDLEAGDKPNKILKVRKLKEEIEFIIEWEIRGNKFRPKNSVVTNRELKKFCPDFLMRYYEDNMVFQDLECS